MTSSKKKYYETEEFKREQAKWYQKLADDGFEDIEDDIPWRLKGSTAMVNLSALKGELGNEHDAHEVDEMLDSGAVVLKFPESEKAEYHTAGSLVLSAAYVKRLDQELLETWALHLAGDGERKIAKSLEISRSRVRTHLKKFRDLVEIQLRGGAENVTLIKEDEDEFK